MLKTQICVTRPQCVKFKQGRENLSVKEYRRVETCLTWALGQLQHRLLHPLGKSPVYPFNDRVAGDPESILKHSGGQKRLPLSVTEPCSVLSSVVTRATCWPGSQYSKHSPQKAVRTDKAESLSHVQLARGCCKVGQQITVFASLVSQLRRTTCYGSLQ